MDRCPVFKGAEDLFIGRAPGPYIETVGGDVHGFVDRRNGKFAGGGSCFLFDGSLSVIFQDFGGNDHIGDLGSLFRIHNISRDDKDLILCSEDRLIGVHVMLICNGHLRKIFPIGKMIDRQDVAAVAESDPFVGIFNFFPVLIRKFYRDHPV